MFCPNCGIEVEEDAFFCSNCGESLLADGAQLGHAPSADAVHTLSSQVVSLSGGSNADSGLPRMRSELQAPAGTKAKSKASLTVVGVALVAIAVIAVAFAVVPGSKGKDGDSSDGINQSQNTVVLENETDGSDAQGVQESDRDEAPDVSEVPSDEPTQASAAEAVSKEEGAEASSGDSQKDAADGFRAPQSELAQQNEPAAFEEPGLSLDNRETSFLVNRYLSNFSEQSGLSGGYDSEGSTDDVLFEFALQYVIRNASNSYESEGDSLYVDWGDMRFYTDLMLKKDLPTSAIPTYCSLEDGSVKVPLSSVGSYLSTGVTHATGMERISENQYMVEFDVYGNAYYDVSDENFYRMSADELSSYFSNSSSGSGDPVAFGFAIVETGYDEEEAAPYKLLSYEFYDLAS